MHPIEERFADYLADHALLQTLQQLACELRADLYLVGGFIRDWILMRAHPDLDLVTTGSPRALAQALVRRLGGHLVELDSEFRIYRVLLPDGNILDFSPLQGVDIGEDLQQRDLTLNAMAFPLVQAGAILAAPTLIDPTHGLHDLLTDCIRTPDPANLRADPVRLLRVFRFSATLGFAIDPCTLEWVGTLAPLLAGAAAERINMELAKILAVPMAGDYLMELLQAGILPVIFTELADLQALPPDPIHHLDGMTEGLEAVRRLDKLIAFLPVWLGSLAEPLTAYLDNPCSPPHRRVTLLKLAALLHGLDRLPPTVPPRATTVARRLKLSAHDRQLLARWVHARTIMEKLSAQEAPIAPLDVYRFFRAQQEAGAGTLLLAMSIHLAAQGKAVTHQDNLAMEALVLTLLPAAFKVSPTRLVDGQDLMESLGLQPGLQLGRLLEAVMEAQVNASFSDKEGAIAWARDYLSKLPPE